MLDNRLCFSFRPVVRRSDIVEIHTAIPRPVSPTASRRPWRQLPETIVLILRATDTNGTGLYTDAPVSIRVARAEKHGPVFINKAYYARLREKSVQLEPPLVVQVAGTLNDYAIGSDSSTPSRRMMKTIRLWSSPWTIRRVMYSRSILTLEPSLSNILKTFPFLTWATGKSPVLPFSQKLRMSCFRLQLSALVSDGVHPPAKVNVTIEIVAVDEKRINRPPRFKTPSYSFVMPAGAGDGFVVGNVIAEDPEGTAVRYHLAGGGEGNFAMKEETGELTFTGSRLVKDETFVLTVSE